MDRALLSQLIAQRFGANHGGDAGENDLAGLLAGQISDPVLATLASAMLRQQAGDGEIDEPAVDHERRLDRAKRIIQRQQADLAAADRMASYIAEVFGACARCWGLNAFCTECHGAGHPGSGLPREDELRRWIEPALARLGLRIVPAAEADRQRGSPGAQQRRHVRAANGKRPVEDYVPATPSPGDNLERHAGIEYHGG